jgi:hypothetical protein
MATGDREVVQRREPAVFSAVAVAARTDPPRWAAIGHIQPPRATGCVRQAATCRRKCRSGPRHGSPPQRVSCRSRIPYGDGGLLPAPLLESAGHQVDGRNIVAG